MKASGSWATSQSWRGKKWREQDARHSGDRKGSVKGGPFKEKEKEVMTGTEVTLEKVKMGAPRAQAP